MKSTVRATYSDNYKLNITWYLFHFFIEKKSMISFNVFNKKKKLFTDFLKKSLHRTQILAFLVPNLPSIL